MSSILFRIALSSLLSIGSLLVILFRVSPLLAPGIAIPLFFITVFMSAATASALVFYGVWSSLPMEGMDAGKKLTISLREGVFLAAASICLLTFQIVGLATWWVAVLIYLIFLLVELALQS